MAPIASRSIAGSDIQRLGIRQNFPPVPVEATAQKLNQSTDLITLERFKAHWQVSHNDLALLTDAPIDTVKSWFRTDPVRRSFPNYQHLHRLTLAHKYWVQHLSARANRESIRSQS